MDDIAGKQESGSGMTHITILFTYYQISCFDFEYGLSKWESGIFKIYEN